MRTCQAVALLKARGLDMPAERLETISPSALCSNLIFLRLSKLSLGFSSSVSPPPPFLPLLSLTATLNK